MLSLKLGIKGYGKVNNCSTNLILTLVRSSTESKSGNQSVSIGLFLELLCLFCTLVHVPSVTPLYTNVIVNGFVHHCL